MVDRRHLALQQEPVKGNGHGLMEFSRFRGLRRQGGWLPTHQGNGSVRYAGQVLLDSSNRGANELSQIQDLGVW